MVDYEVFIVFFMDDRYSWIGYEVVYFRVGLDWMFVLCLSKCQVVSST